MRDAIATLERSVAMAKLEKFYRHVARGAAARSARDRPDTRHRFLHSPGIVGSVGRAAPRLRPENVEIQTTPTHLLPELPDLLILDYLLVRWPGSQRVLHRREAPAPATRRSRRRSTRAGARPRPPTSQGSLRSTPSRIRASRPALHVPRRVDHCPPPFRGHMAAVVRVASSQMGAR